MSLGKKSLGIALLMFLFLTSAVFGRLRYVPDDYASIQSGINDAGGGDTLIVRPGVYHENISFYGQNLVLGSLFLLTGDYSYIETTIIDGDSVGSVFTFDDGEGPSSIVTGFTIRRGKYEDGGGIYCYASSPIITYNIIRNNTARRPTGGGEGGGIYCNSSSAIIMNNLIMHNITSGVYGGFGGGVAIRQASPILINNTITHNHSNQLGGGAFIAYSSPIITNSIFWNNEAVEEGNEVYVHQSDAQLTYCDVHAGFEGEGNINSNPEFRNITADDFRLMSTEYGFPYDSPCIDAGNPYIVDSILDSLWGLGTEVSDMGAFGGGDSSGTDIFDEINRLPEKISLRQNYPNPFNLSTKIEFSLENTQHITLAVYNLLGQELEILIDETMLPGNHEITFEASDYPSGVYYYKLSTEERVESRTMILIK
jgi:hypothetical protein